ncbi:hypothetical protein Cl131_gp019 [Aphanizomenon phage vB_AphaS-CL131]|nr:hypothetical protein Cl131_gp019 [Aphanizomenon phage vB_AphaS-CL131]
MKSQSQLVLDLKAKIQATLKLIAFKIKRYVLQLLELDQKLEVAMSEQLVQLRGSEKQIAWAEKIRETVFSLIENKEAIALENAKDRVVNSMGRKSLEECLSMILAEAEHPKLKKGLEQLDKLKILESASDWICFKEVDLSWNGYIKILSIARGLSFGK